MRTKSQVPYFVARIGHYIQCRLWQMIPEEKEKERDPNRTTFDAVLMMYAAGGASGYGRNDTNHWEHGNLRAHSEKVHAIYQ